MASSERRGVRLAAGPPVDNSLGGEKTRSQMRRMEPEHLGLPTRGAFRSRSRNGATLRLHLSHKALAAHDYPAPAGVYL